MRTIKRSGGSSGFTLIEALIAIIILSVLMAVGIPKMTRLLLASKAASAAELYAEGVRMARQQALLHNTSSRLVLTANATNGQRNWQVDICFRQAAVSCSATTGAWSTTTAAAAGDPEGTTGYLSVLRSADGLPKSAILIPTAVPTGATSVYFNSLGWVDTNVSSNLNRIVMTPATGYTADIRASAVVISLAGTAMKCDPTILTGSDSRACQ